MYLIKIIQKTILIFILCSQFLTVEVKAYSQTSSEVQNSTVLSTNDIARITDSMNSYIDKGQLAGVMTLIAQGGNIIHWQAAGMRDIESKEPLEVNNIFRIYSMTKPITSTAIMILVDRGKIALNDPVSKYIPEFSKLKVMDENGSTHSLDQPVTVKHLLTHTSGLTYGFFGETNVDKMYQKANIFASTSLKDFVTKVSNLPLLSQPGEKWNYSVSTDILGYIIQQASGQSFESFLEDNIFKPLGMVDTAFWVPSDKYNRFVSRYKFKDNKLQPVDSAYKEKPLWHSGGGGLVSTAADYLRFTQMIMQNGTLESVQILKSDTAKLMQINHLPENHPPIDLGPWFPKAYGFGLGFATLTNAELTNEDDHNGIIRWAGIANTFFWIDPEKELIAMIWTQIDPWLVHNIDNDFNKLVYDILQNKNP